MLKAQKSDPDMRASKQIGDVGGLKGLQRNLFKSHR